MSRSDQQLLLYKVVTQDAEKLQMQITYFRHSQIFSVKETEKIEGKRNKQLKRIGWLKMEAPQKEDT